MEASNGGDFPQNFGGRVPSIHQWEMLKKLDDTSITLDEFLKHWRVTKTQLAELTGCHRSTVKRWMAHVSEPSEEQRLRLGLIHKLWSRT